MINKFRVICSREYRPTMDSELISDTRIFDYMNTEGEARRVEELMIQNGWTVDFYYL